MNDATETVAIYKGQALHSHELKWDARMRDLFEQIRHGDAEHQGWLYAQLMRWGRDQANKGAR